MVVVGVPVRSGVGALKEGTATKPTALARILFACLQNPGFLARLRPSRVQSAKGR